MDEQTNDDFLEVSNEDLLPSNVRINNPEQSLFSFENDLWNQLPYLQNFNKKGQSALSGFQHFCKQYCKVIQSFSQGLQKCSDILGKELQSQNSFDTTTIAFSNIKLGLDKLVIQTFQKSTMIMAEIMEPIEDFSKAFTATSNEKFSSAKTYWSELEDHRARLEMQQDRYYRLSSDAEQSDVDIEMALLDHEKGLMTIDQVQRVTNQTLNVKYRAELASQEYKQEVERMNEYLLKLNTSYKPLLTRIQNAEEQRIHSIKNNLEHFIKHFFTLGSQVLEKSSDFQNSVSMINCDTDIRIFIDENKSDIKFPLKVEYRPYEHSEDVKQQKSVLINKINQQKIENNQQLIEEELKQNEIDVKSLIKHLSQLLKGIDLSYDEKSKIISSLHSGRIRDTVAEFLKSINSPKQLDNLMPLKTLGEILKYSLTAFIHDKDDNYKIVYAILHSSQFIFHSNDISQPKVYLTSLLNDHGLWQETQVWKVCIQKLLNHKFHEAIQNNSFPSSPKNPPPQQSGFGLFGQLGKLKGLWSSSKEESQKSLKIQKPLAQNIIFNSLSKFLYHFVNFQLSFETSKEVLLYFCNKYELDPTRTHLLLSELESIQKKGRFIISERDLTSLSQVKWTKQKAQFSNDSVLIIALAVKYIDCDGDLASLLQLNKQTYYQVRDKIYKQALLHSQRERLRFKRVAIWQCVLKFRDKTQDYQAFKNRILSDGKMISNVEEVINMDVQRSFTKMKTVDPVILTNILKTYAFFNPEIEYCQGMNFVAGFLFLVFRDEEKSFKALQEIIDVNNMAELFNQELPRLKLFFYQVDRLLSIHLPKLHSHFKVIVIILINRMNW